MVVTQSGMAGRHARSRVAEASKRGRDSAPIPSQRMAVSRVDTWDLGRRLSSVMTSTVLVSSKLVTAALKLTDRCQIVTKRSS